MLLSSIVCNLFAQTESDYIFIKDGLKWVENYEVQKGCQYTGFVNSDNQPTCYGKYVDASGKTMIGQFLNGKAEGVAYFYASSFSYFGEVSNDEANGIGRQSLNDQHVASLFKNNKSADGLACTTTGAVIVKNGNPVEQGMNYYPTVIYDNYLERIKSLCAQNDIRYVENTTIGEYTYSGGWKNAQPCFYGAYKMRNRSKCEYGIGYITYDESTKTLKPDDTKPLEVFFENYSTISYRKLEVNDIGDTIRIYQSKDAYEHSIVGKDGKYKRNDVFHFGREDKFTKFYKYVNGHPWGLFGSNQYLQEGFLDGENDTPWTGKLISTNGELLHFNNGSRSITFPNGDKLDAYIENTRDGLFLGKYTSYTGDYTFGWFCQSRYGNNNDAYYKTVKPLLGKVYFSDGELKQNINDMEHSDLRYIAYYADKLQAVIDGKKENIGTYTFSNGDVYTGEWSNYTMNGEGTLMKKDGTYKKGTFVNGVLIKGAVKDSKGTIIGGEWKDDQCFAKDSIINSDGTYEKFIKDGDKTIKYVKSYYRVESQDDFSFNGFYPSEIDFSYEGTDDGEGKLLFIKDKGKMKAGDYIEGKFKISYGYTSVYFRNISVTKAKLSFSNGVYEGAINKEGLATQGKYMFKDGRTFEGYFVYSEKVIKQTRGEGTLILADGTILQANWGDNLSYDNAKVTYTNKDVYNGSMLTGARAGQGEYLFANGDKVSATWEKNNIGKGDATYIWSDGRKFVGSLKGNKPGKGVYYNADGSEADKKQVKAWSFQAPIMTICMTGE